MHNETLPPVVLVHGMWSTGETLSEVKSAFESEGYTVYSPSLPQHIPLAEHNENSRRALSRLSMLDYVEHICKQIDALDRPPILLGHSMGGLIAQLVAQQRPLARLILLSSAAPAGINGWSFSAARTFGRNLFKFPLWKKTTSLRLANIRYGIANSQDERLQEEIAATTTLESGLASTEIGMWFLFKKPITAVDVEKISCPIAIIGGIEDKITPPKMQEKIAHKFKGKADLYLLEGVCHWTIGGAYLPKVQAHIFNWLSQQREHSSEHLAHLEGTDTEKSTTGVLQEAR